MNLLSLPMLVLLASLSPGVEPMTTAEVSALPAEQRLVYAQGFHDGATYMASQWLYSQKERGAPSENITKWEQYFRFYLAPTPRQIANLFYGTNSSESTVRAYAQLMLELRKQTDDSYDEGEI